MTPPRLYEYWRSSASYRVRIALNLKGVAYQSHPIDLLAEEQRGAAHLERNPQGLVPVLEIDGLRLTQSLAMIEYLEETRPGEPLLPAGAEGRARVRALCHAIAMEIAPICNTGVALHVERLTRGGEAAKQAWMQRFIGNGLAAFEVLLADSPGGRFCHGERPTMADCCLVPQLYNARRWGLDPADWPRISAVEEACAGLEAFAAAHPDRVRPQSAA